MVCGACWGREYIFGDVWLEGVYMNNPHILMRFDLPAGEHVFTLVVSQYRRWRDVSYSLHIHSMAPVRCGCLPWCCCLSLGVTVDGCHGMCVVMGFS